MNTVKNPLPMMAFGGPDPNINKIRRNATRAEVFARTAAGLTVLFLLAVLVLILWSGRDGWRNFTSLEKARLATDVLVLVLLIPLAQFLLFGWPAVREEVLALFPAEAILLYYRTYLPAEKGKLTEQMTALKDGINPQADPLRAGIKQDFRDHFDARYGRRHYAIPIGLLVFISTILAFLCNQFLFEHPPSDAAIKADPASFTTIMCLAGAYCWVLYDFFSRERSLDLSTTHVNWATFRFIVSVPLAYAVPSLWGTEARIGVAFLFGVFPTGRLMALLRRQAGQTHLAKAIGGEEPDDQSKRLENLPSIDTATADRFREEGITTISQLANADPVGLTIRCGFPLNFVFDCISEALAWYYLRKEGLEAARSRSIPGALQVWGLIEELDYKPDSLNPQDQRFLDDKNLASQVIDLIDTNLKSGRAALERVFRSIRCDSRVQFLSDMYDVIGVQSAADLPACHSGPSVARGAIQEVDKVEKQDSARP